MGIFSFLKSEKKDVTKQSSSTEPGYQDPPQDDMFKAYIPNFLYKPPFGYPLNKNVLHLKALAKNPFIFSVIRTLKDEASTTKWEIKLKKEYVPEQFKKPKNELKAVSTYNETNDLAENNDAEKKRISNWFYNPNGNEESINEIIGQWVVDICEVDAGVGIKVFDKSGKFSQLFARDGGCLKFNQMIETDQGFIKIGEIVSKKLPVKVKSWNFNTNKFEYKSVINYFTNGTTTDWLLIKSKTNTKFRSLCVTPEHKIATSKGYILAGNLNVGNILLTQSETLNKYQEQVLLGSILGDASLTKGQSEHSKIHFKETHSIKQKEYLLWKKQIFKDLSPIYREYFSRYSAEYEPTLKCEISTKASLCFEKYYNLKYPFVKSDIVKNLDLLGLAVWIQDDGHFTVDQAMEISCGKIPIDVLSEMCIILSKNFNVLFEAKKRTRENIIRIKKDEFVKLSDILAPFIHSSMSYKVGKDKTGESLVDIDYSLNIGLNETEIYEIIKLNSYDTKYDIEVEDNHNYFAQGILVSNSILKNPDIYGYLGNRDDIVYPYTDINPNLTTPYNIKIYSAAYAETAAYYQYGWTGNALPVPFGKREVVYIMSNPRTDSIYGRSPMEVIEEVLLTLIYGTSYNNDFYLNGNMPDGLINLMGADADVANAFQKRMKDKFKTTDSLLGNSRRIGHTYPVYGGPGASFVPFQLSSKDMEIIEQQKWFTKLVWSAFGVTPDQMGYSEDSNKAVSQTQTGVYKKKALKPILKKIEYAINSQIMPELDPSGKFEFAFEDYDVQEDLLKAQLYKLQIDGGWKTAEMVAEEEGIDVEKLKEHKEKQAAQDMEMAQKTNPGFMFPSNKSFSEKDKEELEKKILLGLVEDVYKILVANGMTTSEAARYTQSFKNRARMKASTKYIEMSLDDLIAEHKKLIAIMESGDESKITQEIKDQKEELESYIEKKKSASVKSEPDEITAYFKKVREHLLKEIDQENGTNTPLEKLS